MRQIKYRGRNRNTKQWIYGYVIVTDKYTQIWTEGDFPVPVDPETVGAYTGRTDEDGLEIYERDILGFDEGKQNGKQTAFETATVKFGEWGCTCGDFYCNNSGVGFYVEGYHGYHRTDGRSDVYDIIKTIQEVNRKCKVIGNIDDNPTLVEERRP